MAKEVRFPYVLTEIFLILVFSFFILYPGRNGYMSIQDEKAVVFYLLFGGYVALMALFAMEMMIGGYLKPVSPIVLWKKASLCQRFAVLYMAVTVAASLASPHRTSVWLGMSRYEGLLTILLYGTVFLFVSVFAPNKEWHWKIFAAVMILFCVVCLLQIKGGNPLNLYPYDLRFADANKKYAGIYLGTIGNADLVAALLCLVIPVFSGGGIRKNRRPSVLMLLAACLCTVVLWLLDVKAGILGLLGGVWITLPKLFRNSKKAAVGAWCVVIGGIIALLIAVWLIPFSGTMGEAHELFQGNWDDRFGSGRIYIWKQVLSRVPKRFFLGYGPDTMQAANIAGFGFSGSSGQTFGTFVDVAHNEYLNVLYHQGLLGVLAYLGLLFSCLAKWFHRKEYGSGLFGLGCGVICYCIQAFFGLSMCMTAGIFWVLLAMLEKKLNEEARESSFCGNGSTC